MDQPSEPDERDLLERSKAGDPGALEHLLLLYYDRLTRRIARRMPTELRGVIADEDILQQTLIAAAQAVSTFEPQGRLAFYRWLCTTAEFRIRDALKTHRAAKRGGGRGAAETPVWADSHERLIELLSAPRRTPSQSVARHEAAGAIHVALATIPEDHRRVIELRYIRGRPVAEVAEAMGRTPHAIHNLQKRALESLETAMGRSSMYLTKR